MKTLDLMNFSLLDENETLGFRGRMLGFKVMCLGVRFTQRRDVMTRLHSQLDWTLIYLGNKHLDMCMQALLEYLTVQRNPHSQCEWYCLMDWGPRLNKGKVKRKSPSIHCVLPPDYRLNVVCTPLPSCLSLNPPLSCFGSSLKSQQQRQL